MRYRIAIGFIVLLILALQLKLWFGDGSIRTIWGLRQAVSAQQTENDNLKKRNDHLAAEVKNLKEATDAIEERARNDLGMIGRNETFFQVADNPESPPKKETTSKPSSPSKEAAPAKP